MFLCIRYLLRWESQPLRCAWEALRIWSGTEHILSCWSLVGSFPRTGYRRMCSLWGLGAVVSYPNIPGITLFSVKTSSDFRRDQTTTRQTGLSCCKLMPVLLQAAAWGSLLRRHADEAAAAVGEQRQLWGGEGVPAFYRRCPRRTCPALSSGRALALTCLPLFISYSLHFRVTLPYWWNSKANAL